MALPCQSVDVFFWQATYPCHILQNRAKPNTCWRQSFLEILKLCYWCRNKTKDMLLMLKTKQRPCCWCPNKTKVILVMQKQNKRHLPWWQKMILPIFSLFQTRLGRFFCHQNLYQTQARSLPCLVCQWICQFLIVLNFSHIIGFVKVVTWISLSWYMDLS